MLFSTNNDAKVEMSVETEINLLNFRMRAVIAFPSSGKGAFALRKRMKVLSNTICYLQRNPDNEEGKIPLM
jgi:hypothetical protein